MAAARPRRVLPSPAALGLSGPHVAEDLEFLGWTTPDSEALLWTLAGAGDPDLALNAFRRLADALGEHYGELDHALRTDEILRVRLLALLGGSTALGDHLIAQPQTWVELAEPVPDFDALMVSMLSAVHAVPADILADPEASETEQDTASRELTTPGTYRAGLTGHEAKLALTTTYRTLIMRIAACDLAGTFAARRGHGAGQPPLGFEPLTSLLTSLADAALTAALAVAVATVYGSAPVDSRLAVVAMGKCGAGELNYISDVDVIFVAEPVTTKINRTASEFMRIGSACFFEVDANLRPEGRSGALTRTLDSHRAYYRRWASTWEFQALLKARPMTGDLALGEQYRTIIDPMVWTASQRESFVDDVQAMRVRVVDTVPPDLKERELKLGRGGLRDVEFAVQLLQLVHGRSDENLRVTATTEALRRLIDGGYVGREDGRVLIRAYEFLRLLEHRLQLQRLRRTHALPAADDDRSMNWLATTTGFVPDADSTDTDQLKAQLKRVRRSVSGLHAKLFYRPLLNSVVQLSVDELRLSKEGATAQLAALGYRHPDRAFQHLSALAAGNSRRAKLQAILLPSLMEVLGTTADPDAGLLNYRKLSETAVDRSWFLRILRDEGVVASRLMFILGTSPYAADLIIAAPDIVKQLSDGASGPKLLETAPDQVNSSLVAASKRHADPDKAVAVARSLRRAELARIASADLLGFMDVDQVCAELSYVWDAVLEAALRAEVRHSLLTHGWDQPPARIAVIGMGRLGGAELGYGSDADVMIVAEPVAPDTGPDPRPGAESYEEQDAEATTHAITWATAIIESMRARLAKPSSDPPLEVDLGLRPEGRSGAIVRTISSYERYYREWGEVWETQALLRATSVAGDRAIGERFLRMIDQFRYPEGGASAADVREIRRIKARIDNERLPHGADRTTHTKLGRGGLSDIEWTVQLLTMQHAHDIPALHTTSTLESLAALEELDNDEIISAHQVNILRDAWRMATNARNATVLVRGKRTDQLPQPGQQLTQVAAAAGWPPEKSNDFLEAYLRATRRSHNVVEEIFWGEAPTREYP